MSGYQGKKNIPRITVSNVYLHGQHDISPAIVMGRGGCFSFIWLVTCGEPRD